MSTATSDVIESTSERLWRGLTNAAETVINTTTAVVSRGAAHVSTAYNWAGRKVEKLAHDRLPETAAKVVSAAVWALPYTLGVLATSRFVSDVVSTVTIGLWKIVPREIDETIGKENRQHMYTGIRNGYIIRTGLEIVKMIVTRDWWVLVPIIQHIFMALQSNSIIPQDTPEQKFMDPPKAPDEPKDKPATV